MAKYSDEMASIIVPRVMATISDVERKYINDFKLVLKDAVENGMDIERLKTSADDWVNKNVKTQFDGVQDIIKKEFTDYVDDVARKVNPPTPPTPPKPKPKPKPNDITDITGQSWESITPLSSDELKKLEKMYRQKGLGKSFFRAMRTFWKSVEDMMTKQTELMDETLSLIKSYDTVTNAAQKVDIAKRIGDNVQTLTQKDKVNYQIINEWIDTNVIDYKVKSKIKGADGYMDAAKIFDGKALEEWKKTYKGLKERRTQILSQLNSILNPASWAPGVMKSKFGTETTTSYWLQVAEKWKQIIYGPKFAELRRYILTGQSQSWKGIEDFRKEFGFLPAIGTVANANYAAYAGNVVDASQGNITSLGILTGLSVSGNINVSTTIGSNNYRSTRSNVVVSTNTIIDQFTNATYRTAKYILQAQGDIGYQSAEVLLIHDNSDSYITIYGSVYSNVEVITITSNVVSGNIRLYATAVGANTTVNLLSMYVLD
jgi:DNA-binding transcriptional regulator GbsR (MarR family)